MHTLQRSIVALLFVLLCGCNSSSIKDVIDVADGVPRKTIDTSKLGLNAFAYDTRFGSTEQQFLEVRDTLRLSHVRILLNWDTGTHPSAENNPSFNLADSIVSAIPEGVSAMAVVTGMPAWMSSSANWIDGNPRTTFVQRWLKPLVQRYANNPRLIGFQIWNEPNMQTSENSIMGFSDPVNYVEMLALAHNAIREVAPGKLVITTATTAINQNYPDSLEYNRAMRDAGAQELCDIWAAHYYGKQYERVVAPGGVADFLNGLKRPIWITESGAQGVNEQLLYGEQAWPFLLDEVPGIQRIYVYQFTESTPAESTYGLRNLTPGASVSDLYLWLKDRP